MMMCGKGVILTRAAGAIFEMGVVPFLEKNQD